MSYILDAIEEAEKTRKQDALPHMAPAHIEYTGNDSEDSYVRKYWWVGLLLFNVVLLYLLITKLPSNDNIVFKTTPIALSEPSILIPAVIEHKERIKKTIKIEEMSPTNEVALIEKKTNSVQEQAVSPDINESSIKPVVITTITSRKGVDSNRYASSANHLQKVQSNNLTIRKNEYQKAAVAALPEYHDDISTPRHLFTAKKDTKVVSKQKYESVSLANQHIIVMQDDVRPLSSLSRQERAGIPEITLSVHLFNENPSLRKARINGHMYFENQLITDEVRLVNITPNGAIFETAELKFSINLR